MQGLHEMKKHTLIPSVTDHALVRWLERVKGIDVDAIRAEILTPERKAMINAGAGEIKGDGFCLKIRNKAVITVYTKERKDQEQ